MVSIRSLNAILFLCFFTLGSLFSQTTVQVKVDFGSANSLSSGTWNNINLPRTGSLNQVIDDRGFITPFQIAVVDRFNSTNSSGTTNPDTSLGIPSTASGDSFFGNSELFNEVVEPTGAIEISNLDPLSTYDIQLFASRLASDNRETKYKVIGLEVDSALLQVANNETETADFFDVAPNSMGTIRIECSPGPSNDNSFGFFYLGALILEYEDNRPLDPSLSIISPNGGEYWQSGKRPEIRWASQDIVEVELSYTLNNGQSWQIIDTVAASNGRYEWIVPSSNSEQARVRLRSTDLSSMSEGTFAIEQDTTNCHIVVLGSSTAAGTGPSLRDSAWVWMYRDYLFQNDTRFSVSNLARGGFTTYNILPDDAIIPDSINRTIDSMRNVSRAIELEPNGVIINLPSNDAANRFPVADQLRNYEWILSDLRELDIPFWVCTPQPRERFSPEQIQIQLDLLDSTFSIFRKGAIDFWTVLANAEGTIQEGFDSGDGVHLNDAAHKIFLQRVLDVGVRDSLLRIKNFNPVSTQNILKNNWVKVYPNPSSNILNIQSNLSSVHSFSISIYNEHLDKVTGFDQKITLGKNEITSLDISYLHKGMYILIIKDKTKQLFEAKRIVKF